MHERSSFAQKIKVFLGAPFLNTPAAASMGIPPYLSPPGLLLALAALDRRPRRVRLGHAGSARAQGLQGPAGSIWAPLSR